MPLLAVYVLLNIVGQTYGTVWVLFAEDTFHWTGTLIGLSLGAFGVLVAGAQAFATGPITGWLGERRTLLLGIVCEGVALLVLAFTSQGWVAFVLMPLFAFGGIGVPALQSLQTSAVGADKQGQLQGVIASLVGLTAIFGPLVFSWVYALSRPNWTGLVWFIGAGIYALTVPFVLAVRNRASV